MISKEQFNELPQLDRIEFRQKREVIYERFQTCATSIVFKIWGFLFIVGSLFIGLCFGGSTMLQYIHSFENSLYGIILTFVLAFVADILLIFKREKSLKELINEYFDIEVKIKKSKNGKTKK